MERSEGKGGRERVNLQSVLYSLLVFSSELY